VVVEPRASYSLVLILDKSGRGRGERIASPLNSESIGSCIAPCRRSSSGGLLFDSPASIFFIILSSSWTGDISTKPSDQCCAECSISSLLWQLLMLEESLIC